ncbi:hypothetical protein O4215_13340 [Rhodococcus maanshanensis]|uniref:hypothetical protein n=1 Tax=Rhodococcus maanshanensis TaxID=183556 RepID=UPI0022B2C88B|nr:hypothetical protein [Rhodococcus maanshanensis]MCZ4556556.1 hypothetical protein [Rhodococcus maanshanensis]
MTTPEDGDTRPEVGEVSVAPVDDLHKRPEDRHWILYLAAFAVFVGLAAWGLVTFNENKRTDEADAKATELAAQFEAAGLGALDVEATARVLGSDGGAACTDPGSALKAGVLNQQLVSGAAGPGQRPILATHDAVAGARLVIEVYCPEQSAEFEESLNDLKLVDGN